MKKKTISVADLLDRKDEIKDKQNDTKLIYVVSLDDYIEIKKPSRELIADVFEMSSPSEADAMVVYECVVNPNLKDSELQKGFGCIEPTDIVDLIFDPGEIAGISGNCMEFAGFGGVEGEDKKIKKK